MSDLKIVVTGASGRMGRTLIREIAQGSGITLCGALEMEGHPNLGLDSGTLAGMQPNGIKLTADPLTLLAHAQAVVDFTTPMVSTMLAELAAQARIVHVIGTTGFDTLRGGTVVGEHSVIFAGTGERITLSHSAEDRSIFAHGALTAAKWGHGKKPGLYAMTDVLGL